MKHNYLHVNTFNTETKIQLTVKCHQNWSAVNSNYTMSKLEILIKTQILWITSGINVPTI